MVTAETQKNNECVNCKKLVKLKYRIISMKLTKRGLKVRMLMYFDNKHDLKIEKVRFAIGQNLFRECELAQYHGVMPRKQRVKQIQTFFFDMEKLLKDAPAINSNLGLEAIIQGESVRYPIEKKKNFINKKLYYLPKQSVCVNGFVCYLRQNFKSIYVLVRRRQYYIEHTPFFKFMESLPISALLYLAGRIRRKVFKRKINIFYEKFSSKAEEGTFELFEMCRQRGKSDNYFIIDENSVDFQHLQGLKNVVKRFSFKYYWLIYRATSFIAPETPDGHLNVMRTANTLLVRAIYEAEFIFLQHGIIYMKNMRKTSVFCKNRPGESRFMVVSSHKERDICCEMLGYDEKQLLITGIPVYSLIDYKHINESSDDYVMIMLTWKSYEEHILDFSKTDYYRNILEIASMLEQYIRKNKIILVGHPKIQELLMGTDLKDNLWHKPIFEALKKAKLLITDYSSVCYNSFYQGAGVIFYQPDLERYEGAVGKLIPEDDEYIGQRAFDINELEAIIKNTIIEGKIILDNVRNEEMEKIYCTINEFSDGKNIERIYEELVRKELV